MSHTIHILRSVISSPSRMSSTRPITNEWASHVSRRKLQLACAGGSRRDVSILHRLVLISNFAQAHDAPRAPQPPSQSHAFVFPDISDDTPPPPSTIDEGSWLDAILADLEEEAEVMVSLSDVELPAESASSSSSAEDDDVIVCDSYFSICSCPQPESADPVPNIDPSDDLSESLSDLPFYSTPSLSDSMDVDSDEDGPTTPDTSFVDPQSSESPGCEPLPFDDPGSALPSLFDEPVSRSPIIRTCIHPNPFFISTYC